MSFFVMVKVVMVEDLEVSVKSKLDGKVILAAANSQTENSLSCISEDIVLQRREIIFHHYIALAWLPSNIILCWDLQTTLLERYQESRIW